MRKEELQGILGESAHKNKRTRKSSHIEDALYGTLLDGQCKGSHAVQMQYKEYSRPVKKAFSPVRRTSEAEPPRKSCIKEHRDEILGHLRENSVLIIKGGTGTGKTTQVPKILLEVLPSGKLIGCTQPRRAAAVTVADRMQVEAGEASVGYSVRFDAQKGTQIKYMTEGVLLSEIKQDRSLKKYAFVILDEIHEKTVESLLLLKYLLLLVRERPGLKLILMSATLEADSLQDIGLFPVVSIKHTPFPVRVHYLEAPATDYIASIVDRVAGLAKARENILVFLTGIEDIKIVYHLLGERVDGLSMFVLHSKTPVPEQMHAVQAPGPKCILSTNIAETSITIPGIRYVIDCGMYKSMVYDSVRNVKVMKVAPIQKAQASQRAGRTGRTNEGECFRMYTESAYNSLHSSAVSKVQLENLEYFIFTSIQLGLPMPMHESTQAAVSRMEKLHILQDFQLTPLAKSVLKLPLPAAHAIFLLEAAKAGCAPEAAAILGMLEAYTPHSSHVQEALAGKDMSGVLESDHLLLLCLYRKAKTKNVLNINMQKVEKVAKQLCRIIGVSFALSSDRDSAHVTHKSILNALVHSHRNNLCMRTGNKYKDMQTGAECYVSPHSVLACTNAEAAYLVYNEIVEIHRPVLSTVTKVTCEQIKALLK
ncbi:pre-mRNA-splicing factor ATP-dependent RNA helicase DHX38/PRP16 [Nematocida major]|uniref:pre-mRNA-splicing factor ATP-dependent RNA helicase DHX38/PRP16 n=1 Tax=Nematocida major TaxID=1912982 RepID=UPI002007F9F3|nr:pre-mRNA-splicing factor ATP-dependent RNA helicase DHX38/PRP16 [Nematocida major]KAH9385257.1 pre-mRNA-splicing factor ATP-dependent RNA helicase DHX38/PRP16 [Nematocida major]